MREPLISRDSVRSQTHVVQCSWSIWRILQDLWRQDFIQAQFQYAHVVTTTTHKTLRGPRGGMILSSQEVADKYNFNKAIFPGIQGGPLMHVIAAKAVCFKEALAAGI